MSEERTDYDQESMEKVIAFDFDGVVHNDNVPWRGVDIIAGGPCEGIRKVFMRLKLRGYRIAIYTCRARTLAGYRAVLHWLTIWGMMPYVSEITSSKPVAKCYIDDRAIQFQGNTDDLIERIETFASWTERQRQDAE